MANVPIAYVVNCGYARVCIYENSNPDRGTGRKARQDIDISKRSTHFRERFTGTYSFPEGYFDVADKNGKTPFNRHCDKILDGFGAKFLAGGTRESYVTTFSHSNWCKLPVVERKKHTMGKCKACFMLHKDSQLSFPLKPQFEFKPLLSVDEDAVAILGEKRFTSGILSELDVVFAAGLSKSFADCASKNKSSGLEKRKSQKEKRRDKIKAQKDFTKAVNAAFGKTAALSMLSSGQSKSAYHSTRLEQSFKSPEGQPPRKKIKKSFPQLLKCDLG